MQANMSHYLKPSLMSPFGLNLMEVITMQSVTWSIVVIIEVTGVGFCLKSVSAILPGVLHNLYVIMA